jgi:REP element-mobilizing transposase RayT
MPRARKHVVCVADTPYYHVYSRCVRRAFLCGIDRQTGRSYEHRRAWIEDRARVLSSLFSIDLCAYAVMSNHYHLVVKLTPGEPAGWSDDEVLRRWTAIFRGPLLVQRYRAGEPLSHAEGETVHAVAAVYRTRLGSLSWFMKCLNEPIARQANAEDHCTGHFWEARFHSQPLRSEQALLAAMAYVDLNPVRARLAQTPETSEYTSIRARLQGHYRQRTRREAVEQMLERGELHHFECPVRPLMAFADSRGERESRRTANFADRLPIRKLDYLRLLDMTVRLVACGKRGRMHPGLTPTLERLRLSPTQWVLASTAFRKHFRNGNLRLKKAA